MTNENHEAFYSGIISALLVVVNIFDQETIACEILKGCDTKAVRLIAQREGDKSIVRLVDRFYRQQEEQERLEKERAKRS